MRKICAALIAFAALGIAVYIMLQSLYAVHPALLRFAMGFVLWQTGVAILQYVKGEDRE